MKAKFYGSLILASSSPRRKQLLTQAGYKFTVQPPHIDESAFALEGIKPVEYAEQLALAKAKNIAADHPDFLVIGADTLVDLNGNVIGKAADAKDAERILKKLSGNLHQVITALAIVRLRDNTEIVKSETTTVYPKKMTDEQIAEYLKTGDWRDKSGACAIEETGHQFLEKIEGSLTNVMGLPMELLERLLGRIAD